MFEFIPFMGSFPRLREEGPYMRRIKGIHFSVSPCLCVSSVKRQKKWITSKLVKEVIRLRRKG